MFRRPGQNEPKKASYEAQYLGWKECSGMVINDLTLPIIEEIIAKRKAESGSGINILQITVSKKEFKIVQQLTRQTRHGPKMEKYKFPPIPSCDITSAVQCVTPDVVAIIILGYNTDTRRYLHVHVFRFTSPDTAVNFVNHLNDIIRLPANQERLQMIEVDLIEKHEISPAPGKHVRSRSIDTGTAAVMDNLALELQMKLSSQAIQQPVITGELAAALEEGAPILLPPRDYDTISRSQGDSILHHRAIAEHRAAAANRASVGSNEAILPDTDYTLRKGNSGVESPSSESRSSSGFNTPQIVRASHSFGGNDFKAAVRRDKRQLLPFNAGNSLPESNWDGYRQMPK